MEPIMKEASISKRRMLSIEEKGTIIKKLESGESNANLAIKYDLSASTISTIWKNRDKIKRAIDNNLLKQKKVRLSSHRDVEEALLEWFKDRKRLGIPVNGPVLLAKANDFARSMGKVNYRCTKSWIGRLVQTFPKTQMLILPQQISGHNLILNNQPKQTVKCQPRVAFICQPQNILVAQIQSVPTNQLQTGHLQRATIPMLQYQGQNVANQQQNTLSCHKPQYQLQNSTVNQQNVLAYHKPQYQLQNSIINQQNVLTYHKPQYQFQNNLTNQQQNVLVCQPQYQVQNIVSNQQQNIGTYSFTQFNQKQKSMANQQDLLVYQSQQIPINRLQYNDNNQLPNVTTHQSYVSVSNQKQKIDSKSQPIATTQSQDVLNAAISQPNNIRYYYCTRCPEKFTSKYQQKQHGNKVHLSKKISCPTCERMFKWKFQMLKHQESHSAERNHKCEICHKRFKTKHSYSLHFSKTHSNEFKFNCEQCGKGFIYGSQLKAHTKVHSDTLYKCDDCNKIFRDEKYYKMHLKIHKPGYTAQTFTCVKCGAKLSSSGGYRKHMRAHNTDLKYICDTCGKHVTSLSSLRAHSLLHSGEKPFVCEFCGKSFNKPGLLKTHRRVHTKEKPYVCKLCQQRFTQRSSLRIHERKHTGEKPYCCDICQKRFVTKTLLKIHSKTQMLILPQQLTLDNQPNQDAKYQPRMAFICQPQNILVAEIQGVTTNQLQNYPQAIISSTIKQQQDFLVCQPQYQVQSITANQQQNLTYNSPIQFNQHQYQEQKFMVNQHDFSGYQSQQVSINRPQYNQQSNVSIHQSYVSVPEQKLETDSKPQHIVTNQSQDILRHPVVSQPDNIKYYYCTRCPEKFTSVAKQKQHGVKVHSHKKVPCPICGRMFKWRFQMLKHQEGHDIEKNHKCEVCHKLFKTKHTYNLHVANIHRNEFNFKCEQCGKGFLYESQHKAHAKVHSGTLYKCDDCNKVFRDEKYYKTHLKIHKPDYTAQTFTCPKCNAKFASSGGYRSHMRAHNTDLKYICDTCGKHVTSLGSLREHLLLHSGEKPFICEFCGKSFNKPALLKAHRRVHTKEKPYVCKLCQQRFTQLSSLRVHERKHTGEKPYCCDICQKRFVTKTLLKIHSKVHGTMLADINKGKEQKS
ncbi:hypothetical protein ILUMI_26625 [Ignelater luminosus]|uniref:Uncharacterized protein n=1 Tax=Ignelater luminosus TaxID=2038154 RepID=A0A8K0FYG9_IGNLU|nr:hypothetical protein ILUMI_26625 [Ignelater luminosus]